MSTPFKMKGWSPFHQEKTGLGRLESRGIRKIGKRRLPTYKEVWANMSKAEKAKHGSYAAFVKAAKKYHAEKK